MKRVEYKRYGGPEELSLVNYTPDGPGKGEVRVRVHAASINPVDWKIRDGVLKMMTGKKFPRGMGEDFAGIVESVGQEVTQFKAGDQVFGAMELKEAASFADVILTPEHTVTTKPGGLSFEQAATLPTVAQTAWLALVDTGKLQARQRVFVNGCLGSVGRCAIQITQLLGAEIYGTCGPNDLAEAKALGVEKPVDYNRFNAEQFRSKFDIVLDASGNLTTSQCSTMLRGSGVALHINATLPKMFRVMLARRNKLVFLKTNTALLTKVGELAAQGKLTLPISKTVPLSQAIAAVTELEKTGKPKGKVVIIAA